MSDAVKPGPDPRGEKLRDFLLMAIREIERETLAIPLHPDNIDTFAHFGLTIAGLKTLLDQLSR